MSSCHSNRNREMRSVARSSRPEIVWFYNKRPSPLASESSNLSCSTIQHCRLSPRPTLPPNREVQRIGFPFSKSDLSAIVASGKQIASRVSSSNPELTVRQCYGKFDQVSILPSHLMSVRKSNLPCDGSEAQLREGVCSLTSHESLVQYPQTCTSVSSLPSSMTYTLAVGRPQSDGQHNL